jgi:uncharacterized membrane protein YbhN (UPF0104 family)
MKRFETLIILFALGFYVWFLRRFGFGQVIDYLRLAGWGLALTVTLEAVARLANTAGWRATIRNWPKNLSFFSLFVARISGEAVDYATPSAQLGGQFVMAMMVRRKLRMASGLATAIVASLAESLGQIAFIITALLLSIPLEDQIRSLFWPVMGGLAVAVALAVGLFYVQIKNPFSALVRAGDKLDLSIVRRSDLKEAAAEADALLLDFYRYRHLRLAISCFFYLIAWSLGPLEIYILMRLLHVAATWRIALLVEALGLLIERSTFMIPAKLVSQEGGKALILALLGYPADIGFAIGFLRRVKEMVWVLLGLGALTAHRLTTEREVAEPVATEGVLQGAEGE